MPRVRVDAWRNDWQTLTRAPDAADRERERVFLEGHARYGATINRNTADVLAAASTAAQETTRRHMLFLRLFADYVNALESLGAWGWTLQRRDSFRLFLDGFLAYPHSAPDTFYRAALTHEGDLISLLALPERGRVIRSIRDRIPDGGTAREAGRYLYEGLGNIRQAADQYFTADSILLTHYNKAKHGATMLQIPEHTNDELDFQVIAPQLRSDEINAGNWYDLAKFRASDEMIERVRRSTTAVAGSIQQLAIIANVLFEDGIFYGGT